MIVRLFPLYYERYIEVFGGGGWVLFHKPPGNDFEVYNDFNGLLVNLYRCVRDKPEELMEALRYVLNAREDFDRIRSALARDSPASDVQRAAWFYQLIRYSYASGLTSFGSQPHDMRSNFSLIEQAHRRLAKVVIENKDFEKLLHQYDRPVSFFYPILSDLYKLIEQEYREYDGNCHQLYTAELLQEILLGLHSMCQGAEAQFFNGHTNVTSSRFIVFGVKGLLQASKNVRGAMLFNILSYMSDRLLTIGNTTAALDELYVWLSDNVSVGTTIIEYIRNTLKRVRKKESNLIMASQNLEDFDREGIRELTKPLFAIPPHQFIFNCGSIDKRFYMDLLQLEEAEYNLIRFPQRGVCLFKCGNERYLLEVHAPAYKEALFGTAGGR